MALLKSERKPSLQVGEHFSIQSGQGDIDSFGNGTPPLDCQQAHKLRFVAIVVVLLLYKHMIYPSIPYITNSFFAAAYGGGDCASEPDSKPCQQGATDASSWHSVSEASSNILAMLTAVTLGSYSDRVGRLPILQASAVLSALVFACLALHVLLGWSLWMYLTTFAIVEAFDANGVIIAMVLDIPNMIPDVKERQAAWAAFGMVVLPFAICNMVVSYLIPSRYAMAVSVIAAGVHVLYMLFYFPETASVSTQKSSPGPSMVVADVRRVFGRNSFIQRVAVVLALLGFAGAGCSIMFPPFFTGRLGIQKKDKLKILLVLLPVSGFWFSAIHRLRSKLGDVGILRLALAAATLLPVASLSCNNLWQLVLAWGLLCGPFLLAFPTLIRLKSILVAEDEQGVAQGATAGISKGAATFGLLAFGWLFRKTTHAGKDLHAGLAGPFLAASLVFAVAFLLVCSLPHELPPTPAVAAADDDGTLHDDEGTSISSGSSSESADTRFLKFEAL